MRQRVAKALAPDQRIRELVVRLGDLDMIGSQRRGAERQRSLCHRRGGREVARSLSRSREAEQVRSEIDVRRAQPGLAHRERATIFALGFGEASQPLEDDAVVEMGVSELRMLAPELLLVDGDGALDEQ
jgi:hypothetical protein